MKLHRLGALALSLVMAVAPMLACAQTQPAPAAKTTGGVVTSTPTSIFVAPAGGGAGLGVVVAADAPLPVTCVTGCSSGSGGSTVKATAAAPSYVEGSTGNPVSADLHGSQRATILDSAGSPVDWTASVPVTATGNVAHDAVDSGSPLKIGGKAASSDPTAVSAADRVDALFDPLGKQITIPALRAQRGKQTTTITASASETTILTAGAAGVFNDIYRLILTNTSASDGSCTIKDATAGTTVWVFAVKAGTTGGFSGDAGSASPQATAANNWTATCTSLSSWIITAGYVSTKG